MTASRSRRQAAADPVVDGQWILQIRTGSACSDMAVVAATNPYGAYRTRTVALVADTAAAL